MLRPVMIERFGGLDLRTDPGEGASAIDVLNVEFDRVGRVRVRDGYDNFTTAEIGEHLTGYDSLQPFYKTDGTRQLVASEADAGGVAEVVKVLNTSGAEIYTFTMSSPVSGWARIGVASTEYLYVASGADTLRRWDGTVATTPAGMPSGAYLAVQAPDNRLVNCGFSLGTERSRVKFSDPGAPETWGANNYVDVTPGDGQDVHGACSWRELTIVFKETRFFAFYGNATDSTGNPVFNYRAVDAQAGLAARGAYAVAPEGVYFLDRRGVFVTTGGPPRLVSAAIEPIFRGGSSGFYQGGELNHAQIAKARMTYHDERVYLAIPTGASTFNDKLLVYSTRGDYWTIWSIPARGLATFRIGDRAELVFSYATGLRHIGRVSSSYTTDDGAAIVSRYRSSFDAFGAPERKRLRETIMEGIGSPQLQWSSDWGALGTADTVTLGTSPATDTGRQRRAIRGRFFSFQIGAASGAWSVNRLQANVDSSVGEPHVAVTP